ncbi:MAG: carbohydrate ABC transporter permease, partial [Hyphomicrobiales bacterium]
MRPRLLLALGLLFAAIYLFPLYWMYATSVKSSQEIFRYPPTFWPAEPTLNFLRVFIDHSMSRYLWNSLVIALGTTAVVAVFG